jgi:2-keto-4-pentenoate hydratase
MTGSFVRVVPIKAGDALTARFDQGLGDVRIAFR